MSKPVLTSTITCPNCGTSFKERMPEDSCQYFWECENCGEVSRPKKGDCCVYCSYGDTNCPPMQSDMTGD